MPKVGKVPESIKPKKPCKLQFFLKIRENVKHSSLCDVWITGIDGAVDKAARFGLLHGTMTKIQAEALAEKLGLPIEKDTQYMFVCDRAVENSQARTQINNGEPDEVPF